MGFIGGIGMNLQNYILQVNIAEYAEGMWFEATDINPYLNAVTIYDPRTKEEVIFFERDYVIRYRRKEVTS